MIPARVVQNPLSKHQEMPRLNSACLGYNVHTNRKKSKALNKVTKSNTMLVQDSFLGSLLVLPVELWNGIAG